MNTKRFEATIVFMLMVIPSNDQRQTIIMVNFFRFLPIRNHSNTPSINLHELVWRCISTDHMNGARPVFTIVWASKCFAINRNHLTFGKGVYWWHPVNEAFMKCSGSIVEIIRAIVSSTGTLCKNRPLRLNQLWWPRMYSRISNQPFAPAITAHSEPKGLRRGSKWP